MLIRMFLVFIIACYKDANTLRKDTKNLRLNLHRFAPSCLCSYRTCYYFLLLRYSLVNCEKCRLQERRRVGKQEFHPQASHRTVLESLPSHGSCHSLIVLTVPSFPMIK